MNQYSHSEDESSADEDLEEKLEDCNLNDEDQVIDDELYCVACNKFFNSDSAKRNHEASKKHKQNVELLRSEMNAEEENYQQTVKENEEVDLEQEGSDEEEEVESKKKSKSKKSKKKNKNLNFELEAEAEIDVNEIAEEVPLVETKAEQSDNDDDWSKGNKAKKTKSKGKSKSEKVKAEPAPEVKVEEPIATPVQEMSDTSDLRCATCKEIFPSKNKLFAHLKKTNHSIYLGEGKAKVADKSTSKKRK